MSKTDDLLNHVMDMKGQLEGIEQHLQGINSRVEKHERRLNDTEYETSKLKNRMSYWAGGVAVLALIISLFATLDINLGII